MDSRGGEEGEAQARSLDHALVDLGFLLPSYAALLLCINHTATNDDAELDRGNMANAITDNFMEDIGISQDQFNVGQQMLSLGIVLFEIPSNMILYRVGPGKWLTLQLFLLVRLVVSTL